MGEPRDLQYIGSMLQGAPGTSGEHVSPAGRRRDRDAGRGGRRSGSAAAPRSSSRSRVRVDHPGAAATPSQNSDGGPSADSRSAGASRNTDAAAAATGSQGSASRGQRRCELCNCLVHGGEAGWRVHAEGIQHRRQKLSLREVGAPGHTVVSVFEPEASRWEAHRQQRRRRLSAPEKQPQHLPAEVQAAVRALRREIINYCDAEVYQVILDRHLKGMVCQWDADEFRRHMLAGTLNVPWHASLLLLPTVVASLPPVEHLVAAADRGVMGSRTHTPVLAAMLSLLGNALPLLPHLEDVVFRWHLPPRDTLQRRDRVQALVLRAASCFLQNAATALASSGVRPLRHISFEIVQDQYDAQPERLLAARDTFAGTLTAAAVARRQALLMCIHPRSAAAGCLIGHLPTALLGVIMANSLPLTPCTCTVTVSDCASGV